VGAAVGITVVIILLLGGIAAAVIVFVLRRSKAGDRNSVQRTARSIAWQTPRSEDEEDSDDSDTGAVRTKPHTNIETNIEMTVVSSVATMEEEKSSDTNSAVAADESNATTTEAPAEAITRTLSLGTRTFATSNYKRLYDGAKAPKFYHQLLSNVYNLLELYTARINPTLEKSEVTESLDDFMGQLQDDAFTHNKTRQTVDAVAEYLWTSCKRHPIVHDMELCSVLNAVIRDDIETEIKTAAVIVRCINSRRVKRIAGGEDEVDPTYPKKGQTWRGGGFRKRVRPFFEGIVGKKYRVPGFLATSSKRAIAAKFAFDPSQTHPSAIWCIKFDPRGKDHPEFRVYHMTFVSKTLIKGEHEYLFAPYSVFTLVSVEWSTKLRKPHEFVIQAAIDNQEEAEDLPLAPWY